MSQFSLMIQSLEQEVWKIIVGQERVKRDIIIALLSWGHILLEWAPWLAKTRTISTFAQALSMSFKRLQFTPDLLPSDLIGAKIYDPDLKEFQVKKGPIFANFVLADEINRAPSKVQSALLEAMEEKQVTIGEETFSLGAPFIVLATQNPLEQEGTFSLPEAQLDRFLLKTIVEYPTHAEEKQILAGLLERDQQKVSKVFWKKDILDMRKAVEAIEVSESIYEYICNIVFATRNTQKYPELVYGASPRASLALLRTAKAQAFIEGRDFVIPEDIKTLAYWVLRHRIILSYEALAEDITKDDIISRILDDIIIR